MKLKWMMVSLMVACMAVFGEQYEDRWFYVSRLLNNDKELADVEELVRTAGKVKLNGMLFSCGVEGYDTWIPERKERLAKLKKTCDENGVEIIPIIWSIGYGTMLAHNPNYVEGLLTKDMPYVVKGNKAYVLEEKGARAANVDFEKHDGNVFAIKGWTDAAGKRSFADTEVKHGGECSVRLEKFAEDKHGHGRVCIEVALKPNRRYRMKLFAKTEGLVRYENVLVLIDHFELLLRLRRAEDFPVRPDVFIGQVDGQHVAGGEHGVLLPPLPVDLHILADYGNDRCADRELSVLLFFIKVTDCIAVSYISHSGSNA